MVEVRSRLRLESGSGMQEIEQTSKGTQSQAQEAQTGQGWVRVLEDRAVKTARPPGVLSIAELSSEVPNAHSGPAVPGLGLELG